MMARSNSRSRKGAANKGNSRIRTRLLTEWRGGVDPPHPARNIHEPSEYLDDLLKAVGLSDGVDENRLKEVWGSVAGEFVAKHSVPDSIRGGTLVLKLVQPAMKFHLQQMSGQLLKNLHRELGSDTVKKIVFKIG